MGSMLKTQPTIGLFGNWLDTYWPQFPGLEDRLKRYLAEIEQTMRDCGGDVFSVGLVDTVEKAFDAGHAFRRADVDLIFLYATTYALSSTVLPVVQCAKVPVIVLNQQPEAAIDYTRFNAIGDHTRHQLSINKSYKVLLIPFKAVLSDTDALSETAQCSSASPSNSPT